MEKILNLQNNIEASKEKQEERISSYDNYLNNNITNKAEEELKMKKLLLLKKQRDKKKKLEKKMNDWASKQEKISEEQIKKYEKNKNNKKNNNDKNKEKEDNEDEDEEENNYNYNEEFDVSKYNVISLDNMKNSEDDNNDNNDNKDDEKKKEANKDINNEFICLICQRKFASAEKLALHEKLSELHKQNLNKLKLNNN